MNKVGSTVNSSVAIDISVILVNWNRLPDIRENLERLLQIKDVTIETIVVDNGSTDGSIEYLKRRKGVHLIQLEENVGPAAARNIAAEHARGKYILLLDSDSYLLDPNSLKSIIDRMDHDPSIAVMGGQILNYYSGEVDQWIYAESVDTHRYQEFDSYSFAAGGALVRTTAIREVGGFWEDLFIYNDEVDLSIRLIRSGYRIIYTPAISFYHKATPAGRQKVGRYLRFQVRNWIWIFLRHYPARSAWWRALLYSIIYLWKGLRAGLLWDACVGIYKGMGGVKYARTYPSKLTPQQMTVINKLNRRISIRSLIQE